MKWFLKSVVILAIGTLANSATFTPRDARPRDVDIHEPWIGSHTLQYTANPFLIRQSRSNDNIPMMSDSVSASAMISATAESPLTPGSTTEPPSTTTLSPSASTTTRKRRKGRRKVKGRRKIPLLSQENRDRNSRNIPKFGRAGRGSRNYTVRTSTTTARSKVKGQVTFPTDNPTTEKSTRQDVTDDFGGNIEFLPIDQVSLNPTFARPNQIGTSATVPQQTFPSTLPAPVPFAMITSPKPIRFDYVDARANQIIPPIDFGAATHPERLNPSYFRNVILKAMMDRLVNVGVATHTPALLHRVR